MIEREKKRWTDENDTIIANSVIEEEVIEGFVIVHFLILRACPAHFTEYYYPCAHRNQ